MPPPPPESLIQPPSDGDVNRGPALNAVVWVLACTSSLFFCLRVYSRHLISRNPGVEDAIMAFGLVRRSKIMAVHLTHQNDIGFDSDGEWSRLQSCI